MVSNSLNIDLQEFLKTLRRLGQEHGDGAEYQKLRGELPRDWPL